MHRFFFQNARGCWAVMARAMQQWRDQRERARDSDLYLPVQWVLAGPDKDGAKAGLLWTHAKEVGEWYWEQAGVRLGRTVIRSDSPVSGQHWRDWYYQRLKTWGPAVIVDGTKRRLEGGEMGLAAGEYAIVVREHSPKLLAHELGHLFGLAHTEDGLMALDTSGPLAGLALSMEQRRVVRRNVLLWAGLL